MRIVYSLLLAGTFILGGFLCKSFLCGNNGSSGAAGNAATSSIIPAVVAKDKCNVSLKFIDDTLEEISKDNFNFLKDSYELETPTLELASTLEKVVKYLNFNTDRLINIEGLYSDKEDFDIDSEDFENLGLARAASVKDHFEELGVEGDQIMTSAIITEDNCYNDDKLMRGINVTFSENEQ